MKSRKKILVLYVLFLVIIGSLPPMSATIHGHIYASVASGSGSIDPSGTVETNTGSGDYIFNMYPTAGWEVYNVEVKWNEYYGDTNYHNQGAVTQFTFQEAYILGEGDEAWIRVTFQEIPESPASGGISGDYLGFIEGFSSFNGKPGDEMTRDVEIAPGGSMFFGFGGYELYGTYLRSTAGSVSYWECNVKVCSAMDISPNGSYVAFGGYDTGDFENVYIAQITEGATAPNCGGTIDHIWYDDHEISYVYALKYSRDGSMLAIGGNDNGAGTVKIYDVADLGSISYNGSIVNAGIIYDIDWADDQIAILDSGTVFLYDSTGVGWMWAAERVFRDYYTRDIEYTKNGSYIAVVHNDSVSILSTTDLSDHKTLSFTSAPVALTYSDNDKYIFVLTTDGYVHIYSTETWTIYRRVGPAYGSAGFYSDLEYYPGSLAITGGFSSGTDVQVLSLFEVNRTYGDTLEYNNISFEVQTNHSSILNVPVSSNTSGISYVRNNDVGVNASQVFSYDYLANNTFYYDATTFTVYINSTWLINGSDCNWTVVSTHDISFDVSFPRYLEVGDYFFAYGYVTDSSGNSLDGVVVTTRIFQEDGSVATTPTRWNCTNGNYMSAFSTNILEAGAYGISIEFEDPSTGVILKKQIILYLSVDPGPGVYVSTTLHFTFYDNRTGIGLPIESFKIYAGSTTTLSRIYTDTFKAYTGSNIYYRIDDYFDMKVYPPAGSYKTVYISSIDQTEDIPINTYSFSVKNMNHSIVRFTIKNDTKQVSQYIFPYEPYYWSLLPAEYNLTLDYYNAVTGAFEQTKYQNITITDDTYYWIRGYDLRDIIIEIQLTNTTMNSLIFNVTTNIGIVNSTVNTIETTVLTNISALNTTINALMTNIATNISIIDSLVDYLNNTIWTNISCINATINTLNNTLVVHFNLLNVTIDYLNNSIQINITTLNSTLGTVQTNILNSLNLLESNVTSISTSIWNSINITDAIIDYLNNTIWNDLSFLNVSIDNLNNIMTSNFTAILSNISSINVSIISEINAAESALRSVSIDIWSGLNATNATIDYLNTSIWGKFTAINSTINTIDNKLTISFDLLNTNLSNINNNIWSNLSILESKVDAINVTLLSNITVNNSQIESIILDLWSSLNITDSIVGYINNTIWANISTIGTTVDTINNKLTIDFNMLNLTIDYLNNTIWTSLNVINATINNSFVDLQTTISFFESNITSLNTNIWNSINITDSMVEFMNNSIWNSFNYITNNITNINQSVTWINDTIWNNFTFINESITEATVNIMNIIDLTEMNLSTLNINIWSSLNLTDSVITHLNNTIWSNFTTINATITALNNKISADFGFMNTTIDYINNTMLLQFSVLNSSITNVKNNITNTISFFESNITSISNTIQNSIDVVDAVVGYINSTLWSQLNALNSSIDSVEVTVLNSLSLTETNLTSLVSNVWSSINITDSVINHLNNTIWSNLTAIDTTIDYLNSNIWVNLTAIESSIGSINTSIKTSISLVESNLTALNNNIWNSINITDSVISYLNNTIWFDLTAINSTINTINNKVNINLTALNANITNLNNNIWSNLTFISSEIDMLNLTMVSNINSLNTSINDLEVTIISKIDLTESNLSSLSSNIWSAINTTNSLIESINISILSNLTSINTTIDSINNKLTIDFSLLNANISNINNTIWSNLSVIESKVEAINVSINSNITVNNSIVESMISNLWSSFNITDSIVGYLNNTVWTNFTTISSTVDTINNKLSISFDMLNLTVDYINNTIWTELNLLNSSINNLEVSLSSAINNANTTIHTQINSMSLQIDNFNTSITSQVNSVWQTINNTNSTLGTQLNDVWQSIINNNTVVLNQLNSVWQSVNNSNTTLHTQVNLISQSVTNLNTNLTNQVNSIIMSITNEETNITTQLNLMWQSINNTNFTTVLNQINGVWQTVNNTDSNISTQINGMWQEINSTNSTINAQINSVSVQVTNANSTIHNQLNVVQTTITNLETNMTAQLNLISINITNTNTSITAQINAIGTSITNANNTIHTQLNSIEVDILNINNTIDTQFNTMKTTIANHDTNLTNQVNLILASILNNNTNIETQLNSIWSSINNTNSSILTQVNGLYTSITNFRVDINNSFTYVHSSITNTEVNISNLINGSNATVVARLIGILDNVSSGSLSVFDRVGLVLENTTDIISQLGNMTFNLTGNLSVNLSEVLDDLQDVLSKINGTNINISGVNISLSNLFNVSLSDMSNVTIATWNAVNETNNQSMVIFNYYNTNQGLGLDRETLKILINGSRLISNIYYCENGTKFNLTIKDYYNITLYHNNFTVSGKYTFLDLGLTFHSWKFGNTDSKYYMVSLLREGATRWWERGIVPSGEVEYIIPSGNYTMRIYDADYNELHNATYTVNNSRVWVINGTNLTLVINGQSVIIGQLLELQQRLQPTIVEVGYNIPYIRSIYDMKTNLASLLGGNISFICPPVILIATTYNHTFSNLTVNPLIPGNTTTNGTITVPDYDRVWFHGVSDWVNISYDNGTLIQNTSYTPTFYNAIGHPSLNITSAQNLSVTRETTFHQVKQFYWTKYNDLNKYQATVNFTNVLDTTLYQVYLFVAFADDGVTPNYGGVSVYDVTNGAELTNGEHFDASTQGVHMALPSMTIGEFRSFRITYYSVSEIIQPNQAVVVLNDFGQLKSHDGKTYNYLEAQWINRGSQTFIGPIEIQFNFTLPNFIAPESIDIWDEANLRYLTRSQFSYNSYGMTIIQDAVGQVAPMGSRTYGIYFLYSTVGTTEPLAQIPGLLNSPILLVPGIGIILGIHVLVTILLFIGIIAVLSGKTYKDHFWVFASCMIFIFLAVMAWLQTAG